MASIKPGRKSHCRECDEEIVYFLPEGEENLRRATWRHTADDGEICLNPRDIGQKRYTKPFAVPNDLCVEWTNPADSYHPEKCYRPVKNFDLLMCGIHARPRIEEDNRLEAIRKQVEAQEVIQDGMEAQIGELLKYGIKAIAHRTWSSHGVSGDVTVDPAQVLAICRLVGVENIPKPEEEETEEW